jgi:hypothetical protein
VRARPCNLESRTDFEIVGGWGFGNVVRMGDPAASQDPTYAASAALASFIEDLHHRGLLEGEVRESIASSLELFRTTRVADPQEAWHVDLIDAYEQLHGHPPGPPS